MEKEFIPYEQALVLKELGFDKECFGYYHYKKYYQYGLDFENIIFKYKCKLIDKGFNLYPNDKTKRDVYILEKDNLLVQYIRVDYDFYIERSTLIDDDQQTQMEEHPICKFC